MSLFLLITIAGVAHAVLAILLVRWLRRGKSAAERERERRLAVNAVGRIVEGVLLETLVPEDPSETKFLLSYRYWVAGVEYSATQDMTGLRDLVRSEDCWPGKLAAVKYDPHRPSNSIVLCELWSGVMANSKGK